jgi:DnaK suppressor protein
MAQAKKVAAKQVAKPKAAVAKKTPAKSPVKSKAPAPKVAPKVVKKAVAKSPAKKATTAKVPAKKVVAKKVAAKKVAAKKVVAKAVSKKLEPAPKRGAVVPVKAVAKPTPVVKPAAKPASTKPVLAPIKAGAVPAKPAKSAGSAKSVPSVDATGAAPVRAAARQVAAPREATDVRAAVDFLLQRSASRSASTVVVNGRKLLTEEQLLRMPEADYMNDAQLDFFRHQLREMERELLANAGETTEHLRETVIVPDPADRATIEEEHALELRTRDRERKLLKKVQASIARIDSGDYGWCEETGEPIGIPRLLARPTATLSLEAQQRRELKQKLYGD